jgi:hypothetical protein
MTSALRDIGYTEDRSAALDFSSQGTYKQQHDTGQNLKTIIVFPNVTCSAAKDNTKAEQGAKSNSSSNASVTSSRDNIIKSCEMSVFTDVIASKTVSWKQRKNVLKILTTYADEYKIIEGKLIKGEVLPGNEMELYNDFNTSTADKITYLQNCIKTMIDNGEFTTSEKNEILATVNNNIQSVESEISAIGENGNSGVLNKLKVKLTNLQQRRDHIQSIQAKVTSYQIPKYDEIQTLYYKIFKLNDLYADKFKNNSLTISELKSYEEKNDIENNIHAIQKSNQWWYEDDESYKLLCDVCYQDAVAKYNARKQAKSQSKGKTSSGGTQGKMTASSHSTSMSAWGTVSSGKKSSGKSVASATSAKRSTGGNSFASAFGDDSDSD